LLPSLVKTGNATEVLKQMDGQIVTLDSLNRALYRGALPTEEGSIEQFIRSDIQRREKNNAIDHVFHREDQKGRWV